MPEVGTELFAGDPGPGPVARYLTGTAAVYGTSKAKKALRELYDMLKSVPGKYAKYERRSVRSARKKYLNERSTFKNSVGKYFPKVT